MDGDVRSELVEQSRCPAIIVLAWAGALTAAFLFFRGDDLQRLPALLGASAGALVNEAPFGAAGLLRALGGCAIAALMVLAWYGLGDLIVRRPTGPRGLARAERCAVGAGAWSLLWFALGLLHLYRPTVAIVALAIGVTLGVLACLRESFTKERAAQSEGGVRGALALIAATHGLALIAALAPPTAKDTLLYHLALPKVYVAAGGSVDVPYNIASFYPLGVEMQSVWALLAGGTGERRIGEAAAGAALFAWAPLLTAIVYGWARERGADRPWAWLAALVIAAIPTGYHVAASGYVDLALASYVALAMRAAGRWWTTLDRGWLSSLALALGWALCIKLTAAFLLLALGAVVVVRTWCARGAARTAASIAIAGLAALLLAAVLASPWYLRTWVRTGSPIFPFYVDVWGGSAPGWDLERSYQYEALFSLYGGGPRGPLDHLLAPVRLAVAAQLEQPALYDGVLGVGLLAGLPLLLWAVWRRVVDAEILIGSALAGALFLAWLLSSQQLRYLLPACPALAVALTVAGAAVLADPARRRVRWTLTGAAAAGVLVSLAWFADQDPLRVVLGGEPRAAYLERRLDHYPYYALINRELPPTGRVWLINMRRDTYHLERPYFSDFIFEDWTLRQWIRAARDADEVRARTRAAEISHVLVRHDLLFDYDRSPIVDDRRPRSENLAKLDLMASFFRDRARLLRGDQRFWLIELGTK
jgi:hypothetical protein